MGGPNCGLVIAKFSKIQNKFFFSTAASMGRAPGFLPFTIKNRKYLFTFVKEMMIFFIRPLFRCGDSMLAWWTRWNSKQNFFECKMSLWVCVSVTTNCCLCYDACDGNLFHRERKKHTHARSAQRLTVAAATALRMHRCLGIYCIKTSTTAESVRSDDYHLNMSRRCRTGVNRIAKVITDAYTIYLYMCAKLFLFDANQMRNYVSRSSFSPSPDRREHQSNNINY